MGYTCPIKPLNMTSGHAKKEVYNKKKKSKSSNSAQLTLTDSLKQALMTEGNMSADQVQACWSKMNSGN